MTFDHFNQKNLERKLQSYGPLDNWSYTDWACAAAGEMGETCNLIKKLRRGEEIQIEEVTNEIADVVIYLDLLCSRFGESLGEAIQRKFNIVSKRIGSEVTL